MASDLESSKTFGSVTGRSNGDQSGRDLNYDKEHSDQAQTSDHTYDSGEQVDSVSVDDVAVEKGDESDACRPQAKCDIMAEAIILLQSIRESLEYEIQKFEEIGSLSVSLPDSYSAGLTFAEDSPFYGQASKEHSLFNKLYNDEKEQIYLQPGAVQVNKLHEQVNILKSKLEEVTSVIKIKEDQITELESILHEKGELPEASVIISETLREKQMEVLLELENLFKQKIEFEVKYLFISKETHRLTLTAEDQISLIEAQKSLAVEQIQMLHKLKEAEHKAEMLKGHAEDLEASCEQLSTTKEMLKVKNRLYAHALYFSAQSILLVIVFLIFALRPQTSGFVPT